MPLRNVGHLRQQEIQVRGVVAVPSTPPRGKHPRRPAHRVHADARVVGEGEQAGRLRQLPGLDEGVAREGHLVLDRLGNVERLGAHDLRSGQERQENRAQLRDFVRIAGGQH